MKKKVLVIGGTRFVGKRLVNKLLASGFDVTIANRGFSEVNFPGDVERIIINRWDYISMYQELQGIYWDIVIDFVCFNALDALDSCRVFNENIGRYINISTQAVYDFSDTPLVESNFDPSSHEIIWKKRSEYEYSEGKQSAETVYNQMASFPVASVRFPYILGKDDYSNRFRFYVDRINSGIPIFVTNLESRVSLISSSEAGDFLFWLISQNDIKGPINACSNEYITHELFLAVIAKSLNKDVILSFNDLDMGPYDSQGSWYMSNELAMSHGFCFKNIKEWLQELVMIEKE